MFEKFIPHDKNKGTVPNIVKEVSHNLLQVTMEQN